MLNKFSSTSLALALSLGAILAASQASALAAPEKAYDIRYEAAELATTDTAEVVLDRIHKKANELCWDELGPERHSKKLDVQQCLKDVTQDFVVKIDDVNLNKAHAKNSAPRKLKIHPSLRSTALASYGNK